MRDGKAAPRMHSQQAVQATPGAPLADSRLAHYDSQARTKRLALITRELHSALSALCQLPQLSLILLLSVRRRALPCH
jgi:hypothetical protein